MNNVHFDYKIYIVRFAPLVRLESIHYQLLYLFIENSMHFLNYKLYFITLKFYWYHVLKALLSILALYLFFLNRNLNRNHTPHANIVCKTYKTGY